MNKIDSVIIYKIDTLNDLKYNQQTLQNLSSKSQLYLSISKSYGNEIDLDKQNVELELQQQKLYASFLQSKVLNDAQHQEVLNGIKAMQKAVDEMKLYNDSADYFNKKCLVIQSNIKHKRYSEKNFRGYIVLFKLLGSDKKNLEVKKDSLRCYLSPNLRIIPANKM